MDFLEQSSVFTASKTAIRSHSKFPSKLFCDRHPNYELRFFCEGVKCKTPICEECWKNDHEDKSHRIILMTELMVQIESQKDIQKRLENYKQECQKVAMFLEEDWKNLLKNVANAEKKHREVLRSKSTNELDVKSNEVKEFLQLNWNDVDIFKSKILSKIDDLRKVWEDIYGKRVKNTQNSSLNTSSSTIENAKDSSISEKKDESFSSSQNGFDCLIDTNSETIFETRENDTVDYQEKSESKNINKLPLKKVKTGKLGNKKVPFIIKAVYNSSTKEVFGLAYQLFDKGTGIAVCSINEARRRVIFEREMNWNSLRGTDDTEAENLLDIAMDGENILYGIIQRSKDKEKRLEVLDQNNFVKKGQLDTRGIENKKRIGWRVSAFGGTVVLAVYDYKKHTEDKWKSVTVFKNQRREHTVSLNIEIESEMFYFTWRPLLVNATTLLLSCGVNAKKIAVVWLPSLSKHCSSVSDSSSAPNSSSETQSSQADLTSTAQALDELSPGVAVNPQSVRFLKLPVKGVISSLVWLASDNVLLSKSLEGYLFVLELYKKENRTIYKHTSLFVYKVDFEQVFSSKNLDEQEKTIQPMPEIKTQKEKIVHCTIDNATIFATYNDQKRHMRPILLDLKHQKKL